MTEKQYVKENLLRFIFSHILPVYRFRLFYFQFYFNNYRNAHLFYFVSQIVCNLVSGTCGMYFCNFWCVFNSLVLKELEKDVVLNSEIDVLTQILYDTIFPRNSSDVSVSYSVPFSSVKSSIFWSSSLISVSLIPICQNILLNLLAIFIIQFQIYFRSLF